VAKSSKPISVELSYEFAATLLLFLYPYGADQMNLPHNFWLGLACWIVGTAIAIRMFWIFPVWTHRLTSLEKGLLAFILVVLFVAISYKSVVATYGKRNVEAEAPKPHTEPTSQTSSSTPLEAKGTPTK